MNSTGKPMMSTFFDVDWPWDSQFTLLTDGIGNASGMVANVTERNDDSDDSDGSEIWKRVILGIVLSALCLITTVGNAMVLYAVQTEKRLKTVSNMFIVSLAASDFVVGAIVMPVSVIYILTVDWRFGIGLCQFWIAVDYTASTASILNLFILCLDRYWSVTSPLRYIRKRTKRRARRMISIVWLVSALWIIPVVGWHFFASNGVRTVPEDECDTEYANNLTFKVVTAIFNFYLPLGFMYILYGKVFHEIKKRSRIEIGQRNAPSADPGRYSTTMCVSCVDDSDHKHSTFDDEDTPPSVCNDGPQLNHVCSKQESQATTFDCVYDEAVVDSTTERVDRYICTLQPINACVSRNETKCCVEKSISGRSAPLNTDHSLPHRFKIFDKTGKKFSTHLLRKPPNQTQSTKIQTTICGNATALDTPQTLNVNKIRKNLKPNRHNYAFSKSKSSVVLKVANQDTSQIRISNSNYSGGLKGGNNGLSRKPCTPPDNTSLSFKNRRIPTNFKERMNVLSRSTQLSKEIKAARQLGVIMGAFTLCFLPYFILFLYVAFCEDCVGPNVMTAMTWIGYLNSTLNPCLYPLCNANFRRKFRKMLSFKSTVDQRLKNVERNSNFSARFD